MSDHRMARPPSLPLTYWMALVSGAAVLLLAFFMAVDVTSRKLGGPFSGLTDTFSFFVIIAVGTLPLAYTLSRDSHVRIDVLKNFYSARMNRVSDFFAILGILFLSAVMAWQASTNALESYRLGSYIPQSIVTLPLYVPQAIMAIGYLFLTLQAARQALAMAFTPSPAPVERA